MGRMTACWLVKPPAHSNVTSTRSVIPWIVTVTRWSTRRVIRWRSAGVVEAACQMAGKSLAKVRINARSSLESCAGWRQQNCSYSPSSWRWSLSAASQRRSSSRAMSRFSGSTAWYWRSARLVW